MGDNAASKRTREPRQTNYNVERLLILGLVFHLVYIGTVFDCYFKSPVVQGMPSHSVGHAESRRLVLIIGAYIYAIFSVLTKVVCLPSSLLGDGLRADLLFNLNAFPSFPDAPEVVAPYLRSIAEERGAFGISHTRVPTESRPGHVALIGS